MNRRTGVGNLLSGVLSGLIANKQLARQRGFESDELARRDAADAWMREQQGMTREDREIAKADRQRSITRQTEADEWSRKDRAWAEAERKRKQEIEDAELDNIPIRSDEQALMQLLGVFPQAAPKILSEAAKFRGALRIPGRPSPAANVPVPTMVPGFGGGLAPRLDLSKPKLDLGNFISGLGLTAYQLKDDAEKRDYRTKAIGAISEMIKDREKARFDRRKWYLLKDPSLSREQIDVAVDTELPSWNYDDLLGRFGLTADDVASRMNTLTAPVGSPVSSPVPMGQGAMLPSPATGTPQAGAIPDLGLSAPPGLPMLAGSGGPGQRRFSDPVRQAIGAEFGLGGLGNVDFGIDLSSLLPLIRGQEGFPPVPRVQAPTDQPQSQGSVQAPLQGVTFKRGKWESADADPATVIRRLVHEMPKPGSTPAQLNEWRQQVSAMRQAASALRQIDDDEDGGRKRGPWSTLPDVMLRAASSNGLTRGLAAGLIKELHPNDRAGITPEDLMGLEKAYRPESASSRRYIPGTPENQAEVVREQLKSAEAALIAARKASSGYDAASVQARESLPDLVGEVEYWKSQLGKFSKVPPRPKPRPKPEPKPRPAPVAPAFPTGNPVSDFFERFPLPAIGTNSLGGSAPRPAPTVKPKVAPKPAPKAIAKAVTVDQARAALKKQYPNATPEQIEAAISRAKASAASGTR